MRKPGQPTLYKPEYCQMLIEHMEQGYSFQSFAAIVDVCEDTLYDWCKKNPEFAEAHRRGSTKSRLFYEKMGIDGLFSITKTERKGNTTISASKSMNSQVWIASMRTRFHDWNDTLFKSKDDTREVSENKPTLVIEYSNNNNEK